MRTVLLLLSVFGISACQAVPPAAQSAPPLGSTVRAALRSQIVDVDAGRKSNPENGIDGRAAADAIGLYRGTFKVPPPVTNVINIGGAIGSK